MADQASSSSSNTTPSWTYDVFLSFRGEDTRKTFADHLYTAFLNAGLRAFRDEEELERGEEIKPNLQKAIQQSRSSVIVLSRNYASSGWCLDELVIILEHKRTSQHLVLPVFYSVDPSHVRNQTGLLAEAFDRHEKNQKNKVGRWRAALEEVADIAALVLQNESDGHESMFIKKIVRVIEDKVSPPVLSVAPYLIGIPSTAKEINMWLKDESTEVGIYVIYGMRGIGKTTIARYVYDSNFKTFEGSSFLENIREVSGQPGGLIQIQKQLLFDILNGTKVEIHNISHVIVEIEKAIRRKRVLLVFDDVDDLEQLDALLRIQSQCSTGSKIIITTSHADVANARSKVVRVHEVKTLSKSESLELFSWHAFGQDRPYKEHMKLSKEVVDLCGGLPLALKTVGSSLSPRKSLEVWESTLQRLKAIPDSLILKKLRISYDSLQNGHDQNLFLHIACFFIGVDKDITVRILDSCGFFTEVGIQNLIDRCLITVNESNIVQMHQMIRDMGREIVQQESKDPGERSRLWHHGDSYEVLKKKKGTKSIEGLCLNMRKCRVYTPQNSNLVLDTDAFECMHNLRLLQLSSVQFRGCYDSFPSELRWLCWNEYLFDSLPSDLPLESLVVLEICYSSLREVWKGTKYLPSLKILNLSHSNCLTETPDFSHVPSLERLILKNCTNLVNFHESIRNLKGLVYLNVEDCKNITKLPILEFLETLVLSGCSNINVEFPVEIMKMRSLKVLQADGIPIPQLLTATEELNLGPIRSPEICWVSYLPCNLIELSLSGCNLSDNDFPLEFGNLSSLRILNLSCNPIRSLPNWIRGVVKLDELSLSQCTSLKILAGLPAVGELIVNGCISLETVTFQTIPSLPRIIIDESNCKLVEIEYYFKLEPLETVDKEMIKILSLRKYLNSIETVMMDSLHVFRRTEAQPIQGLYEYGIFSTFLHDNEVPGHFTFRPRRFSSMENSASSIQFTVPGHPIDPRRKIRGLNIFAAYYKTNNIGAPRRANAELLFIDNNVTRTSYNPIVAIVENNTKRLKWIYGPSFFGVPHDGREKMLWLSHWKFGNKLAVGDSVDVSVKTTFELAVEECGVEIVYDDIPSSSFASSSSSSSSSGFDNNTATMRMSTPFTGFRLETEMSPSDSWMMKQRTVYFLCCRPEGMREIEVDRSRWFNDLMRGFDERTVCFGDEFPSVVNLKPPAGVDRNLRRTGGESRYPIIIEHEDRSFKVQVKAFFRSLVHGCKVPWPRCLKQ